MLKSRNCIIRMTSDELQSKPTENGSIRFNPRQLQMSVVTKELFRIFIMRNDMILRDNDNEAVRMLKNLGAT